MQTQCNYIHFRMKNKAKRLSRIREIVHTRVITSQDQLLEVLNKEGFEVTQATLSRDLKYLGAGRIPDGRGSYRYVLSASSRSVPENESTLNGSASGFLSMEFARDLVLIFTLPGYASTIAIAIDQSGRPEVAGTIAGDDTILVIPRDGFSRQSVKNVMTEIFPEAADKINLY